MFCSSGIDFASAGDCYESKHYKNNSVRADGMLLLIV